jgi:hypothetical protein
MEEPINFLLNEMASNSFNLDILINLTSSFLSSLEKKILAVVKAFSKIFLLK